MYWKVLLAHWQLLLSTGDTQQQHDRASVGLRVPYTPQVATLSRSQPYHLAVSFGRLWLLSDGDFRVPPEVAPWAGSGRGNRGLLGVRCRVTGWWVCGLFSATEAH